MARTKQTARGTSKPTLVGLMNHFIDDADYELKMIGAGRFKRSESFKTKLKRIRDQCEQIKQIRISDYQSASEIADKLYIEMRTLEELFRDARRPFASTKDLMIKEITALRAHVPRPRPTLDEIKDLIQERQRQRDEKELNVLLAIAAERLRKHGDQFSVEVGVNPILVIGTKAGSLVTTSFKHLEGKLAIREPTEALHLSNEADK